MARAHLLLLFAAGCSSSSASLPPPAPPGDAGTGSDVLSAPDGASAEVASPDAGQADGGWTCTPSPAPPVGAPITGLTLGDGFTDPRALPAPVDTTGWEDSSIISADGQTLYFAYTQWDYTALSTMGQVVVTGPARPGQPGPQFNLYQATIQDGGWTVVPSNVDSTDAGVSTASDGVDDPQSTLVFVQYFPSNVTKIYLAKKHGGTWGTPEALPSPINTPCVQDNAAISGDGTILYFDSNRVDPLGQSCGADTSAGGRKIYTSRLVNGAWSTPALVAGAPNQGDWHWQGYSRDPAYFYWSGHDTSCGASTADCIYRAHQQPDGSYAETTIMLQPVPDATAAVGDAVAVGEASVTCDGHYLYFIYIQKTATGGDLNVGVAHKP